MNPWPNRTANWSLLDWFRWGVKPRPGMSATKWINWFLVWIELSPGLDPKLPNEALSVIHFPGNPVCPRMGQHVCWYVWYLDENRLQYSRREVDGNTVWHIERLSPWLLTCQHFGNRRVELITSSQIFSIAARRPNWLKMLAWWLDTRTQKLSSMLILFSHGSSTTAVGEQVINHRVSLSPHSFISY